MKYTRTISFNMYCPYLLAGGHLDVENEIDDITRVVFSKAFEFFNSADDME